MTKLMLTVLCVVFLSTGCATHGRESLPYIGNQYDGIVPLSSQEEAGNDVVQRLLGKEAAKHFAVKVVPSPDGIDYFDVYTRKGIIHLQGSTGVAACRGLKWYLNELCAASISWNGDNLNLPEQLPMDFERHREETRHEYRYIFNNCVYGYSMPWWKWDDWERMLDVLAFNGINMPALLLGQEKIWQETYKEFGFQPEHLEEFFAGPAWYPWQWMGNLDGWGGPAPQSVIDGQAELQKRIVNRARSLGMKTVLPGFSGHIPEELVLKYPGLKHHTMNWWGFGPTYIMDWEDPLFTVIGETFLKKQREYYGTDHYYNIDPFNEMTPPKSDKEYLAKMARAIFSSMNAADPDGVWVIMTWFARDPAPTNFWTSERTRHFFEAAPDDRMLALELWGENYTMTGWHRFEGWYGKPWVWNILQNFGNRVDIYGGLDQIHRNYTNMIKSPNHGNISGMGIMTEGLGYNPVVYELVLDMMWGDGVSDLDQWKQDYLIKRYGSGPDSVNKAWDRLYQTRYKQALLVDTSPLCFAPRIITDFEVDVNIIESWNNLVNGADEMKHTPAYKFDLVNVGREAMGGFAPYYTMKFQEAFEEKDLEKVRHARASMIQYIRDFDRLLATDEHFLLGTWLEGARSWGETPEEKALLEWGAKRQITDWGRRIGTYAIKEWSGYITDCMLPAWDLLLARMEESVRTNENFDKTAVYKEIDQLLAEWPEYHSYLPTEPTGDAVQVSREMRDKYYPEMMDYSISTGLVDLAKDEQVKGIAFKKPVTATGQESRAYPEYAVDGRLMEKHWGAPAPASITVDLEELVEPAAFHVYPYRGDNRYYQYTIEVSSDGSDWIKVVDMSENTEVSSVKGHFHPYDAGRGFRYARLNMLRNSVNLSVHVIEFKILSHEDMEEQN